MHYCRCNPGSRRAVYRYRAMDDRRCLWCDNRLPERDDGRETRLYCSHSHRQLAYIARRFPEQADRDRFNREHMRAHRRRRRGISDG